MITDLISKFSDILGGLDAIEASKALNDELRKDHLLKKDVDALVRQLTPFIPALGILSGGITMSKHMYSHMTKKQTQPEDPHKVPSNDTASGG